MAPLPSPARYAQEGLGGQTTCDGEVETLMHCNAPPLLQRAFLSTGERNRLRRFENPKLG